MSITRKSLGRCSTTVGISQRNSAKYWKVCCEYIFFLFIFIILNKKSSTDIHSFQENFYFSGTVLSERSISHEKGTGPTKSHGSYARIGWDTFYWFEGNSRVGFMVRSHYLTLRLMQMGCIELREGVHTVQRRTSMQIPIGLIYQHQCLSQCWEV